MDLSAELSGIFADESLSSSAKEELIQNVFHLNFKDCEENLESSDPDVCAGLAPEAFSTPFLDYHAILQDLAEGEVLADLGAGHAKGSLLCEGLRLKKRCLSLELEPKRVAYGRKLAQKAGLSDESIQVFDLKKDEIPLTDAYFVYLPLGPLILKPLEFLLSQKHSCVFYVVESHGDVIDFFENLCWFKLEKVILGAAQRHRSGIHKFKFTPRRVKVENLNSYDFIHWLTQNHSRNTRVTIVKESGQVNVLPSELIPIKYNGKMVFECAPLKRLVDFKNVCISNIS